jgi:hypothetical protein
MMEPGAEPAPPPKPAAKGRRNLPRDAGLAAVTSGQVTIPPELVSIGIDAAAFAERVEGAPALKKASTWQKELSGLARGLRECGEAAVMEAWENSVAGSYQGCNISMIRDAAAKQARRGNGKPPGLDSRHTGGPDGKPFAGGQRPTGDDGIRC